MTVVDTQREEQLVLDNMGLVVSLAKSFRPPNPTELDEYIQLGRIGLFKAIRKHDPSKAKLSTLAWLYIRWEIIRYIESQNKNITLPLLTDKSYDVDMSIWEVLPDSLTDIEKQVVALRLEGRTFKDIGKKLGDYSRGWANTLYTRAIKKANEANQEEAHTNVQ